MIQWDDIDIKDLEGDMVDVAETLGLSVAKQLIRIFGGESIYFPKAESVIRASRDRQIYKDFNGFNLRQLSCQYNLTTRQIRTIIQEQRKKSPKSKHYELNLF